MTKSRVTGILAALSILGTFNVQADQYHYGNLLIGGKAIGYGGAFVALANDQSAMHYNPAGLAFQDSAKSASVNTLAFEDTQFKNVYTDGSDFKRSSFSVVPGFLGISSFSGNFSYGSYFTVTDFSQERTDSKSTYMVPPTTTTFGQQVTESVNYDFDNAAYKFGGAFAYRINPSLSVGLGLSVKYIELVLNQTSGAAIVMETPDGEIYTGFDARRRITEKQFLFEPSISVIYKNEYFSAGAKYALNESFKRSYRSNNLIVAPIVTLMTGSPNTTISETVTTNRRQSHPSFLSAGLAYTKQGWTISTQIDYYSHVDAGTEEPNSINLTRELKEVTNYSLGLRIPINGDHAIQLGLFTDNSNGLIDLNLPFQRVEIIDTVGLSLSYETKLMNYPLTIGAYAKKGDGKVRYADVRYVEAAMGVNLYPANDTNDVKGAEKSSFVFFASMDF